MTALTLWIAAAAFTLAPQETGESPESQESPPQSKVKWQEGPLDGKLGDVATIRVPEGFLFTDAKGTRTQLEEWENITDGSELGMVGPAAGETGWRACFEYRAIGKVKDDEKLEPAKLFEQMKEGEEASNEARKERGFEPLVMVRWTTEPHYDAQSHNLEWGLLLRSPSGETVNYNVKLLGRYGLMSVTLLCDPEDVDAALPQFQELLAGYAFTPGKKYSEWTQGDPIAEIGITGLIVGGAAAAAWKLGIFGKLLKFAKVIVVAILGAVAVIWKKITGKGSREPA